MPRPRLGEVWNVNFDPALGHEQGGVRPGLVISNDRFNRTPHTLCFLVPLTRTDRDIPSHLPIHPPEGGLRDTSFLLCDQVKSLSVTRLLRRLGTVDQATVERVQIMVGLFIDR
ncbi:MAG: type II toxin-antitoxin system PemK/MazF family toxin [Chloroflexia bacterium]|nr:type II toxin-antitoxin system PemK/MazF family toxin [Chloroflexia bacterium]